MIDVTFIPNGLDLSKRLSTYEAKCETTYKKVITTMDDTEHAYAGRKRWIITFSLLPGTEEENEQVYTALYPVEIDVIFTNPHTGRTETRKFRLVSDLEAAFLLRSIDGKRRYRGETLQLREK